jgi:hypothetical protein
MLMGAINNPDYSVTVITYTSTFTQICSQRFLLFLYVTLYINKEKSPKGMENHALTPFHIAFLSLCIC